MNAVDCACRAMDYAQAGVYFMQHAGLWGLIGLLVGIAFWRKPWFRDVAKS